MKNWTKRNLIGAAVAGIMALPVAAEETISAVVIDGYPDRALWVKEFSNFFIPEVDKLSILTLTDSTNHKTLPPFIMY